MIIVRTNEYFFKPAAGVLQGEILSSYMFSIFINDLPKALASPNVNPNEILINLLMYADDMCCLSYSRQGLQEALNKLSNYCNKWGLTVNTAKTKCMAFRKNGRLYAADKWNYNDELLETVKEFKYLGYNLSASGSSTNGTKDLRTRGLKAIFNIKCICQKNKEITPKIQLHFFDTLVKPVLNYACEVWGGSQANPLETIYLRYLKQVLGVRQTIPNAYIYGELGAYPLYIDRYVRMVKYWLKVISSTNTSLIHVVYKHLKDDIENDANVNNWASKIKHILESNGFGYIWLQQCINTSDDSFIRILKQRLTDQYLQIWNDEIEKTSNNRMYKLIKNAFGYEEYLDILNNSSLRKALAKIRLGSHNFMVERGRWGIPKVDYNQRKCTDCLCIEDEYHCIIECPRFQVQRKNLPPNITIKPSMWKFILLLKTNNVQDTLKLAITCSKILAHYETFK